MEVVRPVISVDISVEIRVKTNVLCKDSGRDSDTRGRWGTPVGTGQG